MREPTVKIDKKEPGVVKVVFYDVSGIPTYTARLPPIHATALAMELVRKRNELADLRNRPEDGSDALRAQEKGDA